MDRGQERDGDRRHGDGHDVHDLDVHRDAAQVVDVPRQGVEGLDRPAEAVAQRYADHRPDDADHEPVQHEDARHGLAGRAHRLQDGDLPVLLHDDHGERAHDVEGGDDHDQYQQDEHHELLQLERREQVLVELHPVARPVGDADRVLDRLGDAVRREDVRDLHLDAGHRVAHVEELLRLLDRHVDQRRIVLVHPGLEHAGHAVAPYLREHAQGSEGAHRGDDVQPVAHEDAQPQRQLFADDHAGEQRRGAGRPGVFQLFQPAGAEVLRDLRDRRLAPHVDAAQHDAVRAALRREQDLLEDERGGGDHLRDGGHFVRQRGVVLDRLAGPRGDDDVRVGAEDLGLQVFTGAGHAGQRGGQGRNADGPADEGDERIERDGAVAALGPEVAETDEDLIREVHGLFFRTELREEDHVANGRLVGQQHDEPVNADPIAGGGRHAVVERAQEVLIQALGRQVSLGPLGHLRLEASALVQGVVQLREGVGDLAGGDVELEAIGQLRVARLAFGQGGDLNREVGDERRLDQRGLDHLLEQQNHELPVRFAALELAVMLLGLTQDIRGVGDLLECRGEPIGDRGPVANAFPGASEGDRDRLVLVRVQAVGNGLRPLAVDGLDERHDQFLGQGYQVRVVRVCHVELEHRELGVVNGRDALVPEVAVDLVDPVQPANDQPLEVELRGHSQVQVGSERVVVGDERPRRGAAGDGVHHRRFHLQEALADQEGADGLDDPAARDEDAFDLRVGDQVHIALPVAGLHIGQAVPFFWERAQGLAEQRELFHLDRQLVRLGPKERAADTDPVTDVQQFRQGKALITHDVFFQVHLHGIDAVLEGGEGSLAEPAQGGHPAGESGRDGLALQLFLGRRAVTRDQLAGAVLNVKLPAEGIDPQTSQLLQLLEPLLNLVV